jgi:hypothetical protein
VCGGGVHDGLPEQRPVGAAPAQHGPVQLGRLPAAPPQPLAGRPDGREQRRVDLGGGCHGERVEPLLVAHRATDDGLDLPLHRVKATGGSYAYNQAVARS